MPRESQAKKRERATRVMECMAELYPNSSKDESLLHYVNPFTLLIAVLLSAQTTDVAVNKVTPELFRRWPTPQAMASANPCDIAEVIRSIGFYNTKSKNCVLCAQKLLTDFGGEVPQTMEELTSLAGVGRKTANIVLNTAFGRAEGIAVDTHVFRISRRLRLSAAPDPSRVEKDLLKVIPQEYWSIANHSLVLFGREFCRARHPRCMECPLHDVCPSAGHAVA